jgi:hypothetical protein
MTDDRERLTLEANRVVGRLRSPTAQRERTELVREVAQQLADLAAAGAGRPSRVVPTVEPYALADQIAVMAADVAAESGPAAIATAAQALQALRRQL